MRGLRARPGVGFAIAAAALFGVSTPMAKLLLGAGTTPQLLAGLLYLGSGIGLSVVLALRLGSGQGASEARLRRSDLPQLAVAVLLGGALAPVCLMAGLEKTAAAAASLLLNLEGLFTMLLAWVVFRENVDRSLLAGAAAILAGALVLSWGGTPVAPGTGAPLLGALLIGAACLGWAIDNNVTRSLSRADPVQIAAIKGLVAGLANLALAYLRHVAVPNMPLLLAAGVVGFLAYGVSLVLFVLALRNLGAARTAAYFSTAPFIGAILALAVFAQAVTMQLALAGSLMAVGLFLHLRERHEHNHHHALLEHEHRHVHDAHHQHAHLLCDPQGEPHSHLHRHVPLTHSHPHYPDLHHHHEHS